MFKKVISRTLAAALAIGAAIGMCGCPNPQAGTANESSTSTTTAPAASALVKAVRTYGYSDTESHGQLLMAGTIGGAACYWLNGSVTFLNDASGYVPTDICSDGSNIYVTATNTSLATDSPCYWKNGVKKSLTYPNGSYSSGYATTASYSSDSGVVYIAGSAQYSDSASGAEPVIWCVDASGAASSTLLTKVASYTDTTYNKVLTTTAAVNMTTMAIAYKSATAYVYIAGDCNMSLTEGSTTYADQLACFWIFRDTAITDTSEATYLGTSAGQNSANSIILDSSQNAWISGYAGMPGSNSCYPCYWKISDPSTNLGSAPAINTISYGNANGSSQIAGGQAGGMALNTQGTAANYLFGTTSMGSIYGKTPATFIYSISEAKATRCALPSGYSINGSEVIANRTIDLNYYDIALNGENVSGYFIGILNLQKDGISRPCYWLMDSEDTPHFININ